jgi:hypothetical protein
MKLGVILEGVVGAAAIAGTAIFSPFIRGWYSTWGASREEVIQAIPGDHFVPRPKSQLTMAITVNAPAVMIWPWFVQLGCQRAGWYSYDLLDNGGIQSADRILSEYQQLSVGELVKATPKGDFGFPVAIIEPNRQLTMAGTLNTDTGEDADPEDPDLETYFSGNQTFLLNEVGDNQTRLIFRMRIDWNPKAMNTIAYRGIVEPLSFVMARNTLLNVKRLVETVS